MAIYAATIKDEFKKDYPLRDQVRRAGISIMSNIAEGFGRKSSKEFVNFLSMAHASAAEVQSHLYVALGQKYISEDEFLRLYSLAEETSMLIQGLSKSVLRRGSV